MKNSAVKNSKGMSGAAMMPPICSTAMLSTMAKNSLISLGWVKYSIKAMVAVPIKTMKNRNPNSPGKMAVPNLIKTAIMGGWSKYPQSRNLE